MNNDLVFAIGLMSGTSLDGVDIVYAKFNLNDYSEFEILSSTTFSYDKEWKNILKNAVSLGKEKLEELDSSFGVYLGNLVLDFIQSYQIEKIDFIASHGHTIFHEPEKGITLQIGDGQKIADITKCKVVCDFRTQDVEMGGQGAPLVPIGDQLLFSEFNACINLGGFANISFEENERRIAFDICPVNTVLNLYVQQFGFDYDDKGKIASKGTIKKELLTELNSLRFYQQKPPKSLGIEWVSKHIFPLIDVKNIQIKDVLRTFVEHVAIQISNNIVNFDNVLFTGGGVYNAFLIERIKDLTPSKIIIPNDEIINFKEALIFAFLGLLKIENKVNCLSSVTGAKANHSSGKIFIFK